MLRKRVLILAIILLVSPRVSEARAVHYFQCADCHRSGSSLYALDGLCLKCHEPLAAPVDMNGTGWATPDGEFTTFDASNAMGTHPDYDPVNAMETSHLWSVGGETNPAAGAQSPTLYASQFNGRYNISRGKVICNRCHNPHGTDTYDKKLLKLNNSRDQMCRDCHLPWATSDPNAFETHPLVTDYNAVADPARFNTSYNAVTGLLDANVDQGEVRLLYNSLSGKYMVSCTSCHGVHFTDSDATTPDGTLNRGGLNRGDGKLLRSDGPERTDADPLLQAQLRSNLCQACHNTYQVHGKVNFLGCLDCHSGHSYDPTSPNYYVLRKNVYNVHVPKIGVVYNATGLDYSSADVGGNPNSDWMNGGGTGYCQGCHTIPEIPAGSGQHNGFSLAAGATAADCGSCHQHSNSAGAFLGSCNSCHGYPPQDASQGGPTGYAFDNGTGSDYSTSGVYKNESTTPHKAHAGGSGDYSFGCGECHGAAANSASHAGHDTGTFQEVPFDTLASGGGNLTPAYAPNSKIGADFGICSTVYCHSNGGARTSDTTRNYVAATNVPAWQNGLSKISGCTACHGNDATSMSTKSNSARHEQHVGKYGCNVCHKDTAASSTALALGAMGGKHVNGVRDVVYNTAYNLGADQLTYNSAVFASGYDSGTGRCSVYCHSNGNGALVNIPDWDAAVTGSCTVCHDHDTTDTPMATGSHANHIDDSADGTVEVGWNLGCVECHANTVTDNNTIGTPVNHVNGAKTLGISRDGDKITCSNIKCHSDGNFDGTLTYKDPTWGVALAGCDDCHGDGAGNAYPSYANGGAGVDANSHAPHINSGITCEECHSGTATGNALKTGGTALHVNQTVNVNGAKIVGGYAGGTCSNVTCHGGNSPVWGDTGLSCADCHLGTGDTDDFAYDNGTTAKVDSTEWTYSGHGKVTGTYDVTNYNAANLPGSVSAAGDACKFCHDGGVAHGDANYFRLRTNASQGFTDLNGNCLGCHATGSTGVDPDGAGADYASKSSTIKVDKYHGGAKHTATTDGGRWCWDCHDPHGDASAVSQRIEMIQRRAAVNPNYNSVPAGLTGTDILFYDRTVGAGIGGFARDATWAVGRGEGICNACHTGTTQYTPTLGKASHFTDTCIGCHEHSKATAAYDGNAFQGSACNGCHGDNDGLGNGSTGQYWPDGDVPGNTYDYADNQAGAHDKHLLAISQELYGLDIAGLLADAATDLKQKEICAFCHKAPGGSGHSTNSGDSRVDVYQDSDDGTTNADVFRKWGPAAQDYASDIDSTLGNQAYSYASATCSNLACHNRTSTPASWNTPPAGTCAVCHTGAGSTSGRHDSHVATRGYACTECHVNNVSAGVYPTATGNLTHADGDVDLLFNSVGSFEQTHGGGAVTYNGTLIFGDANFGACSSAACHADTQTPAFNAALATPDNCNVCHGNTPGTGAHASHLSATYGPNLNADCGGCHAANANNNDMTGHDATHVNGSVTFSDAATLGATTACNACHGGATPAGTARTNWPTATAVSCESCHGDYADAVVGGNTAPHTAGSGAGEYDASGHGKSGVAKACADCHDPNAAGHMDGDFVDTRLAVVAGYNSATDPVGYCAGACHAISMKLHYTNGASGTSFPADGAMDCLTCHNPHGQNLDATSTALDTMIRPVIDGKNIVALYNTAVRANYYVDPPNSGANLGKYGICQACHDPADASAGGGAIDNFNRTTANPGHYSGACTSCHKHDDATVAFKPSGCNGCHGDATAGNFWPDTAGTVNYPDRAGLHPEHVDAIGDAINGGGPGSATLDDKNATCVYCHPDPGGNNVDGAGHDTDTVGSPASNADLHKDGWNPATSYLNMQTGSDPEGLYTPAIKRCSTVDCHSSGEFTWTWYPDALAPGTVVDLTAATGTEPGTVELTWTAPSNDGAQGPNAYQNEVRYGASAINDGNWASAAIAGGPPSVVRRGKLNGQKMTVKGLTPGAAYYFAVKTADEADNWSNASNGISAAARVDDQAPVFWGIDSATAADEPGTVMLTWEAATDHSPPVTYQVWYNVATIDFAAPPQASTQGINHRVTGLPPGILYNFAARAEDSAATPNTDSNNIVMQQLARPVSELSKNMVSYYTSGTTALQTGAYGTANSSALAVGATRTWEAPAYSAATNVVATTFYVRMGNGSETTGSEATGEFGYTTGGVWNSFVPSITSVRGVAPNTSNTMMRFAFGSGGTIPAGGKPAVRITNTGGLSYTVSCGSAANRGDIDIQEQLFNHLPTGHAFSPQPSGSGIVTIGWTAASDQDGHTLHYDVHGSDDGGQTYDYVIATGLPAATTSVQWDTMAAGIGLAALNNQVRVKVLAGDGYESGDAVSDHTPIESLAWTVDNTVDTILPGQITDLTAETRPKMGSVYLHWTAPGDDGNGKAPAAEYDIRYSTSDITNDAQFDAATTVSGEPVPGFGGTLQGYEVLGLTPNTTYYFALKTRDEQNNWSLLSNSATASGGLKCGICHGTPPDDSATAGNHIAHGYTLNDCAKCHGPVTNYNTTKHQNGLLEFGFGRDASGSRLAPVTATVSGANGEIVSYWQDPDGAGPQAAVKIYEDADGAGGFNETAWAGSDKVDSGACFGFTSINASGCHGPATPSWDENASLVCADCHGDHSRLSDLYDRPYDDTGGDIQASPPNDNHGYQGLPTDPIRERRYVGQHEKHLNSSFRFAKGDSCRMCHKDNNHADGVVDFAYDYAGAGESALWTPYNTATDTPGSCAGTSDLSCHGVSVTPKWDSAENVDCNTCHGFGGLAPDHVTDPNGAGFVDDGKGNCEWCHPAGHPREGVPANMVLIPNNPFVGITYASGGIHLKTDIAGRGPYATEAEMCWGCHDGNGISEWGTNTKAETGGSPYNYGTLQGGVSNWVGATWVSGTAAFGYKQGVIQSTHTTSPDGASVVTWNPASGPYGAYEETPDAVANIRCTNCHDVHNRNLANGDASAGTPYLRGTWKGNPYPEDGAPQAGTPYTAYTYPSSNQYVKRGSAGFGAVPRGGADYNESGGYFIDENSGYPTKGWTLGTSAGLCVLCHGSDVDELDQQTDENLWLSTNGHSNSAIGGTAKYKANIFDYSHGRPTPVRPPLGNENQQPSQRVANMGNQDMCMVSGDADFPYGYRNGDGGYFTPSVYGGASYESIDCFAFNWGISVDNATTDVWYHQFSCSKCHNPHASRLPKLMITNCLDVRHNTWDDAKLSQTWNTNAGVSQVDYNKKAAYFASAQNCHRYDGSRSTEQLKGGWNKVTPW